MIVSILYVLLAVFGISFLIFIHELGHYFMARRVGMRVETFAIGFGKPIYTWVRDGVKWQIGWLLFGGYVKIAGAETDSDVDPYTIPDGFFGKRPWDRIKVAFAGPFVNLLFAFLLFTLLWAAGGRSKNFSEFTRKIGWVDPNSELYCAGVRPGDEIAQYDDYPFQRFKDHLYAPLLSSGDIKVEGFHVDYQRKETIPFELKVTPYPHPALLEKEIMTVGILYPANHIIYDKLPGGYENPLPEGSPLKGSGIQYGDRILWVDGELIFSSQHLSDVLNDNRVLLTIRRNGQVLLRRVPRILAQDLRPQMEFREELIDWQYEAGLNARKNQNIYVIPYNLTYDGVVESVLRFVDAADEEKAFPSNLFSTKDAPLKPGDQILAVQGTPVGHSCELLRELQQKKVNIIVQRQPLEPVFWNEVDVSFYDQVNMDHLDRIVNHIGTRNDIPAVENLVLLSGVIPKTRNEFPMSDKAKALHETQKLERRRAIENIQDPQKKQQMLNNLDSYANLLVLGLPSPQDREVKYNPPPTEMFINVAHEIWRTLTALFSGTLSPKHIAGPVGIIHVVHSTSQISIKETLFWIAAISLNLGFLNLLPIPILDGGTILLSFFELITRKRVEPKVLEKVVVVFAVLLVAFFLFLTYNDITRLVGNFLN